MGWVKLDDGFFRHPKVLQVGRDAKALYLAGLCYSGAQLTDGFIPLGAVKVLAADAEIAGAPKAAKQLVEAGLWDEIEDGFLVHDGVRMWPDPSLRPPAHEWRRLRDAVFQRDDFTCQYCGERGGRLECDHVIPVTRGGSSDLANLATACFACNRSKRAKTVEEWHR